MHFSKSATDGSGAVWSQGNQTSAPQASVMRRLGMVLVAAIPALVLLLLWATIASASP